MAHDWQRFQGKKRTQIAQKPRSWYLSEGDRSAHPTIQHNPAAAVVLPPWSSNASDRPSRGSANLATR
ncbi:MAG: hypothetical protein ACKO24_15410 [Leptolyngbyaceae cyanobacterium]